METVLADLQIFKYTYLNGRKCKPYNIYNEISRNSGAMPQVGKTVENLGLTKVWWLYK